MSHARLSASGSATWLNCPASPRLCDGVPDKSSGYAAEGTRAHEQAEAMLLGRRQPHPELADDVLPYVELVEELSASGKRFVEQRLEYTEWVPEGFGTADAVVIHEGTLTIVDLKFGKGIRVSADGNTQLRLYALAALQEWQWEYDIATVTMTISQPRLDHVSSETLTVEELLAWGDWVKKRVAITQDPQAPPVPGEKQCRWCRARFTCRARAIDALTVAGSDHLAPSDIAALLPHLPGVIAWADDIEAQAVSLLESGAEVAGYKLVEGRSVRKLTDNAVDTLRAAGLDDSTIYRQSYRTLADIEKALGGKKNAAPVLEQCTTKPAGKPAIVLNSDPRPPISATVAQFPVGE